MASREGTRRAWYRITVKGAVTVDIRKQTFMSVKVFLHFQGDIVADYYILRSENCSRATMKLLALLIFDAQTVFGAKIRSLHIDLHALESATMNGLFAKHP